MTKTVKFFGASAKKAPYSTPSLTVFGSVRELTGNSSGAKNGDAGTMMTL